MLILLKTPDINLKNTIMSHKNYIYILLIYLFSISFVSCQEEEKYTEYIAIPKTEIGKKLVENTDLIALVYNDTTYEVKSGVSVTELGFLSMTGYATHMFIYQVDLTYPEIHIEVSTPYNKPVFGRQKMTEQATYEDSEDDVVLGGINGDFFDMNSGVPFGIVYKDGVAIKTYAKPPSGVPSDEFHWFAITNENKAIIGNQDNYDDLKSDFQEAIGGGVMLLQNGKIQPQTIISLDPRTTVGVTEDGTEVYFLVVDGRYFSYSSGMNYLELADCMKALGVFNAVNLDGGGSSTFFMRNEQDPNSEYFEIINHPSDNGGEEREVANGLLIKSLNK